MFEKITPEQAGISSRTVNEFIEKLEKRGAATHGLMFVKDGKIFTEAYWKPFNKDFCHRMYSQTKSFVGVAIGLLEEEGKLELDDKIIKYFPDEIEGEVQPYLSTLTIREMLTMQTAGGPTKWMTKNVTDRTHQYLNEKRVLHPSGTIWAYDSAGSQVLTALVEKLSGKTLLDYMKEKLFNKMDAFQNASVLKTPNGDSWGDSAMICTLRDMVKFGQLVMNYGVWNGERLMNEKYLRDATSCLATNKLSSHYCTYHQGYGYQIWRVSGNGFAFVGMGDQLTVCYPDKKLIFACASDNQGTNIIRQIIFAELEDKFVNRISDVPLTDDENSYNELNETISKLELRAIKGLSDSPYRHTLSGVNYVCCDNPMGITEFSFKFVDEKSGEFIYTNVQGNKVIPFGVNYNVFGQFPQLGYSDEFGNVPTTNGFMYKDAASLAWLNENEIMLFVQIIDKYFGNMSAKFNFKGDEVYAVFSSNAECFLNEYKGELIARVAK